ncbi:2'-5' RNA ligase family protein [Patescibacteria group bacterium]|nr:MAG: 2'-5' RNA ligase family protein [Patescibacteria group bacterium]
MNKMRYTIVAFASPDIQKKLEAFRKQFGIEWNASARKKHCILKDTAHLAVKRTFLLRRGKREEELVDRISALSVGGEISVHCAEVGVFADTAYGEVIYVRAARNPQLEQLHMDIKQKVEDLIETKSENAEGKNYIPHVTLAYDFPKDKVAAAQQYINREICPVDFSIRQIVLLRDYDVEKDGREIVYIWSLIRRR